MKAHQSNGATLISGQNVPKATRCGYKDQMMSGPRKMLGKGLNSQGL